MFLEIRPVHFYTKKTYSNLCDDCWREQNWDNWKGNCDGCWVEEKGLAGEKVRFLKNIKVIKIGETIDKLNFLTIENNGFKLARFYDKKFWETEVRLKDCDFHD